MGAAKSESEKDIFQRLAGDKEKREIFDNLALNKMELQARLPSGETIKVKAIRHIQSLISCEYPSEIAIPDRIELVFSFFVGGEKYFMRGRIRLGKPGLFSFSTDQEVYVLQRRENFRVRVPADFRAILEYTDAQGKLQKVDSEMFDISAGGCRLRYYDHMPNFHVDQKVSVTMKLGRRPPIEAKAQIRHKQEVAFDGVEFQVFGLQFIDVKDQFESKLLTIVIDLHRELFSKWTLG
ncbi:MAG: flagellar brake protein [Pseudobdellovibrionaceae bacterium]